MTRRQTQELRPLEGRTVTVALANGNRIDGCQLVACPRPGIDTLWVFAAGADLFLPPSAVLAVYEHPGN
jgi:hypothetical protein